MQVCMRHVPCIRDGRADGKAHALTQLIDASHYSMWAAVRCMAQQQEAHHAVQAATTPAGGMNSMLQMASANADQAGVQHRYDSRVFS